MNEWFKCAGVVRLIWQIYLFIKMFKVRYQSVIFLRFCLCLEGVGGF